MRSSIGKTPGIQDMAGAAPLQTTASSHLETPEPRTARASPALGRPRSRPSDDISESLALIARSYRGFVGRQTSARMVEGGSIWRNVQQDLRNQGILGQSEPLTLERLSAHNLKCMRTRVLANGGKLDAAEWGFLERFLDQPFWATHFTDAVAHSVSEDGQGQLRLMSGPRLKELGISHNATNTTLFDTEIKGDQDCVFFSLECGDEPQKQSSRFGTNSYRVPIHVIASVPGAWGALDDLLLDEGPGTLARKYFGPVDDSEETALEINTGPAVPRSDKTKASSYEDVFRCDHLLIAAGLSLIAKFRSAQFTFAAMDATGQNAAEQRARHPRIAQFLDTTAPNDFNKLMTFFHRIEVRVPRRLTTTDFEYFHHGPRSAADDAPFAWDADAA